MRRSMGVALVAALLTVAGCTKSSPPPAQTGTTTRGGTLYVLMNNAVEHWDPQRMYAGPEAPFAVRTFVRTLTTYPAQTVGFAGSLVGDLATGTGTAAEGGRVWQFTLRDDVKWQDGRQVTCADVKYGVSRAFARDQVTGGPPYPTTYLDIPLIKDSQGRDVSAYRGPYSGVGQAFFDTAVTCELQTITFRLKVPVLDFNQAVTLPVFAPFRQDQDKGGASNFSVFSAGPYMLEGVWEPGNGGRFVRNPNWDPRKDPVRSGYPNVIDVREGIETTTAIQRIIDDKGKDRFAVTYADAPPAVQAQLMNTAELASRVTNPDAPTVEYLVPNFKSPVMSNPAVRQAFAMATNRDAFVGAYGGPTAMTATFSVLSRQVPGRKDVSPFGVPTSGDPAAARDVLAKAGVSMPVPVRLAYRKSSAADTAFAALKAGWDQAGFAVTLDPITDNYYPTIRAPEAAGRYDVFRASWSADWPSGSTVLPNNFDGRVNLTAMDSGQDYGYFNDEAVNRAIDAASRIINQSERDAAWGAIDEMIAKAGGHIALGQAKYVFIHGSGVAGYQDNPVMSGYVDLADIQVPG